MLLFEEKKQQLQMPELCRQRLLGYADSFRELAKSFEGEFEGYGEDRRSILEKHRLWENRQVICTNLNEMAQIMTQMAGEVFCYQSLQEKKARFLCHALKAEGILLENSYYIPGGEERLTLVLTLRSQRKGGVPAEAVADMLCVLLKKKLRLSVNSPFLVDHVSRTFLFVEEASYITLTGLARVVKDKENISGDNYSIIESERGKMTILLSDGTGSGEKACEDSGQVLDLMEKLLETGYHPRRAVNLVNAAMFAREEGISHPTLDMCCLDLYQGSCDFCKVGGAASFMKRNKEIELISGGNLPLGIFQNVDVKQHHCHLKDGDYLIMLTDGVLDVFSENNYEEAVCEQLSRMEEQNPQEIAEAILQMAIFLSGGHIKDDMTVLVAGIWENV
ncbi:MAG: SpoIIE family protein phosphatase [Roseburia sp.]|nr:SpoIIE family protein phosphatase [Roseburia sp.]